MTTGDRGFGRPTLRGCALLVLASLLPTVDAFGQLPQTKLQALFPPGAQSGQTLDVKVVSGADIDELASLEFNHPGITASQKMTGEGEDAKPVAETFVVTIAGSVEPGLYEARARGLFGISNPRAFRVSAGPTSVESETNNTADAANEIAWDEHRYGQINGRADIDYFSFEGQAGQVAVVVCESLGMDSKLQMVAELQNERGDRLAYGRQRFDRDPLLTARLPADGRYFIKVHDFVYSGSTDLFYGLRVTSQPHVAFVFPPVVRPGEETQLELYGYNLPNGKSVKSSDTLLHTSLRASIRRPGKESSRSLIRVDSMQVGLDSVPWVPSLGGQPTNPVNMFVTELPIRFEEEPNNGVEGGWQTIDIPTEVVGRFETRGDIDGYLFEAKAGEVLFVEVVGHRVSGKLDPYFVLEQLQLDEQGAEKSAKRIVAQDDGLANLGGVDFNTLTDDPIYRFAVPSDGVYRIRLWDRYRQSKSGLDLIYRLIVRREKPNFSLVAVPSTRSSAVNQPDQPGEVVIRRGENRPVRVLAVRKDGFDGPIRVSADGLPDGVSCDGAIIGPGQSTAELIFRSTSDAAVTTQPLRITGHAVIEDAAIARRIVDLDKQVKTAADNVTKATKPRDDAAAAFAKQQAVVDAAAAKLNAQPENAGLKKTHEAALASLGKLKVQADKTQAAFETATSTLKTQTTELANARKSLEESRENVTRTAIAGGIVWPGATTVRPVARLQSGMHLCVLEEVAQVQVDLKNAEKPLDVTAGQQLLFPVELQKRNKFDNNVALSLQGLPRNSRVLPENKTINKGSASDQFKITVDRAAPEGSYTMYLQSTVQVPYERNLKRVELAKAEVNKVDARLKASSDLVKAAGLARDPAKKLFDAKTAEVKAAKARIAPAQGKADTAKKQLAASQKLVDGAATAAKTAESTAVKAADAVQAAEQKLKAAADDKQLADALKKAQEAAAKAGAAKKQADQKLASLSVAHDKLKSASDRAAQELATLQKTAAGLDKAAEALKADYEAKAKKYDAADAAQKAIAKKKTEVDKELKDATTAAKARNTNYRAVSRPILLTVHSAPVQLTASVAAGGKIKRGAELELTAKVQRLNDFKGPVRIELNVPPAVSGLSADPVTIADDAVEAKLKIKANGEATEGALKYLTVRAISEFNERQAAVDAPVNITVSK